MGMAQQTCQKNASGITVSLYENLQVAKAFIRLTDIITSRNPKKYGLTIPLDTGLC
jgi:hypothetical protein